MDSLFNAMATAAFFEFVIFAVFEMRYMLNIWKSRQGNLVDSRTQQRELLGLYARFYFALLCSIFISYQAQRCDPDCAPCKLHLTSLHEHWLFFTYNAVIALQ